MVKKNGIAFIINNIDYSQSGLGHLDRRKITYTNSDIQVKRENESIVNSDEYVRANSYVNIFINHVDLYTSIDINNTIYELSDTENTLSVLANTDLTIKLNKKIIVATDDYIIINQDDPFLITERNLDGGTLNIILSKIIYKFGIYNNDTQTLELSDTRERISKPYMIIPDFWFYGEDISQQYNKKEGTLWKISISLEEKPNFYKYYGNNTAICLSRYIDIKRNNIDNDIKLRFNNANGYRGLHFEEVRAMQILYMFKEDIKNTYIYNSRHHFKSELSDNEKLVIEYSDDILHNSLISNVRRYRPDYKYTINFDNEEPVMLDYPMTEDVRILPNDVRCPITRMHITDKVIFMPSKVKQITASTSSPYWDESNWCAVASQFQTTHDYTINHDWLAQFGCPGTTYVYGMNPLSVASYLYSDSNSSIVFPVYSGNLTYK